MSDFGAVPMTGPLAVVSGGTRGIGRALSERLLNLGHRVVALYHANEEEAAAARSALGLGFTALACDVSASAEVTAAVQTLTADHGPVRVLVNNAGLNVDKPFLDLTDDDWHAVLGTNLTGAFLLTRALVSHMRAQPDPVIVNIGATTGIRPRVNGANYCASKAGLMQLTKCLALELAPDIRVNCLVPGMIETEEVVTRFHLRDPVARERIVEEIPQRRLGHTDDIAAALEFLVNSTGSYVNGQRLIVDGGQFMW
ncbi:SDR family NAD(P)-dependent oxidoreductase [Streptomyces olivaceus]|uniref:SDR family NAD(P)-dependent oxidoreductase n=1 Tax=Streptomyces olivaceus TaxID=47716 RepID=UPI00363DA258